MKTKPILCLDFDGVVHSYQSGWKGAGIIPDPPVPGAIDFIVLAQEHFNIAIHSSRMRYPEGPEAIREYLIKHGITREYVATSEEMGDREWVNGAIVLMREKPPAFVTLDDRAVTFTGTFPDPAELLMFRPWNKQSA